MTSASARGRRYLGVAVGFVLTTAAIAACSKSSADAPTGVKCTPGNYVFCRCEDRSEGTKLCRPDGVSFDDCKCDGTGGPITEDPDAGFEAGPLEEIDSGGPTTGPTIDAKCINKLGLIAGGGADVTPPADKDVYLALYSAVGTFKVSEAVAGLGIRGPATILPVGTNLIATYLGRYGYMGWSKMTPGGSPPWSSPDSLGDGTADTSKPTSMTLIGGQLRVFYYGQDDHYHMGTYAAATGWDNALTAAPIAEASGDAGTPIPGKSAPTTAAVGSSITLAFTGDDGTIARETFSSGSWSAITKFSTAPAFPATPAVVALDGSGTSDELMVYAGQDLLLHVSTRAASNKVWSAAILFDTAASSTELALAQLPGGKAMLVYRTSAKKGFYSVWAPGTGFSTPAELVAGKNPDIASVPSVIRGQCGSDATIAYAQKDGTVKILKYTGTTMAGPFDVGGITKASWVGVGELP